MSNRVITNADDLDSLPLYSVVLDINGTVYQHCGAWKRDGAEIEWFANGGWWHTAAIRLPVRVISESEASK